MNAPTGMLMVIDGDAALELLIAHATLLLERTADPLMVRAQRELIAMRSPERVAHMEQEMGLG